MIQKELKILENIQNRHEYHYSTHSPILFFNKDDFILKLLQFGNFFYLFSIYGV